MKVVINESGHGDMVWDNKLGRSVPIGSETVENARLEDETTPTTLISDLAGVMKLKTEAKKASSDEGSERLKDAARETARPSQQGQDELSAPRTTKPVAAPKSTMVPLAIPNNWGAGSPYGASRIVWVKADPKQS